MLNTYAGMLAGSWETHLEKVWTMLRYRVAHLLWERIMLTQKLKLRLAVSLSCGLGQQRNLEFDVKVFLSRSRWATLYISSFLCKTFLKTLLPAAIAWQKSAHLLRSSAPIDNQDAEKSHQTWFDEAFLYPQQVLPRTTQFAFSGVAVFWRQQPSGLLPRRRGRWRERHRGQRRREQHWVLHSSISWKTGPQLPMNRWR